MQTYNVALEQNIGREDRYAKDTEELGYKEHGNLPEWAKDNHRDFLYIACAIRSRSAREIDLKRGSFWAVRPSPERFSRVGFGPSETS